MRGNVPAHPGIHEAARAGVAFASGPIGSTFAGGTNFVAAIAGFAVTWTVDDVSTFRVPRRGNVRHWTLPPHASTPMFQ
ncbi:hypothetical protein NS334_01300 [Sphingomonas endophytica]|uniref:Uncharacterized protein n=1 Tax=Sphingomonas endophytica TaxID=869719 RepID=A0A147I9J2_9SPHN|nr:hypothetical protein NS334_01300 [Sphingomonas endophytica]